MSTIYKYVHINANKIIDSTVRQHSVRSYHQCWHLVSLNPVWLSTIAILRIFYQEPKYHSNSKNMLPRTNSAGSYQALSCDWHGFGPLCTGMSFSFSGFILKF